MVKLENVMKDLAKCLDTIKSQLDEIDKKLCKIAKYIVISSTRKTEVSTLDKEDYD